MIAILTLIAFSVQEIALSAPTPFQVQEGPNREAIPPSIQIPPETGEIRAVPASISKSNLYIIHIQDAHGNYEAQQNIGKILEHLRDQYGIGLIFKEGADEKLDPSFFHFFEDRALDLKTADLLMRHGAFSGVEKFLLEESINPGAEIPEVYGMEDGRIYSEDLALFRSVTQRRKETLEWIFRAKTCVETLESRLFSRPLLRFVREWKKFKRTESGIGNFAAVAGNAALDSLSIDLKDPKHQESFGSVLRLLKLQEIEAGLDFE